MIKRFSALLGFLALGLVAGCNADWNQFEKGMNKTFVEDSRFSDLECDSTGCYICDEGSCNEYSCDTTNQCPQGYVCTIDQQCLPGANGPDTTLETNTSGGSCSNHNDCGSDQLCTLDGQCVPRSEESPSGTGTDTPDPSVDPSADANNGNTAIPLPDHPNDVCVVNSDCGSGVCLNAECYFPCAADSSCPAGQQCDQGQCLPLASDEHECTFNGECGPGLLCIEGLCHNSCTTDTECGANEFCGEGLCQADTAPVIQCSGPNSCEDDKSCFNGKCLDSCAEADSCSDNFSCEFGFCHQEVFCLQNTDCSENLFCLDGRCQ
jgi:hypothetical protein